MSQYLAANYNGRYGPDYDGKCLFGHYYLNFGRFTSYLAFDVTTNGFQNIRYG